MTAAANTCVRRKKETCTHVKEKNKLQTCMQVCMCEVRPCTERDKRKQTTNMHEVGMCSVRPCTKREKKTGDEREKRKQPPNIYASGLCGVRLCVRERKSSTGVKTCTRGEKHRSPCMHAHTVQ